MERTTISIPKALLKRLKLQAAERGTSMAALIREALEEKAQRLQPRPKAVGIADSGFEDTSELAGEVRPVPRS